MSCMVQPSLGRWRRRSWVHGRMIATQERGPECFAPPASVNRSCRGCGSGTRCTACDVATSTRLQENDQRTASSPMTLLLPRRRCEQNERGLTQPKRWERCCGVGPTDTAEIPPPATTNVTKQYPNKTGATNVQNKREYPLSLSPSDDSGLWHEMRSRSARCAGLYDVFLHIKLQALRPAPPTA